MRAFLEEYGIAIFLVAIIVVLVVMATPLGKILGNKLNDLIQALTSFKKKLITAIHQELLKPIGLKSSM